ncbi:MAG: GxxExxY protein [Desulfuromonadales bacterium]|nr:GxxExxY protein [Desulfuromonadales bacterium]
MTLNDLSGAIKGAAIEVHRELGGPGLLEDIYESALSCELALRGIPTKRQVAVPVLYKGHQVKHPHFIDLLVDNRVVVEVKATEKHSSIFETQLLTYLRLSNLQLGLVINFGERHVRQGIRRVVNGIDFDNDLRVSAPPR